MKKLLVILLSLLSFNIFSQDTLKIPQAEIDEIIAIMDTLVEQDSINNILILQQTEQIQNFETLAKQDSLLLMYRNQEIVLLNEQIRLYDNRLKQVDKWYNKRWVGFVMGTATILLLIHSVDYTLP